ncbi:uncharacterized protein LOC143286440 [Babylonia areolata]|uniref:uncharacterized protein LOC143286440 n=1 Tax=Babylonia areolata TaxID=304850 RepID=UPI003FD4566C
MAAVFRGEMLHVLMLLLLLLPWWWPWLGFGSWTVRAEAPVTQSVFHIRTGLTDRQFSEGQLFFLPAARSLLDCARRCSAHPACLTFTFTPDPQGTAIGVGACRAHDVVMTSQSPSSTASGAITYRMDKEPSWFQSSCVDHDSCSTNPNVVCWGGVCTCYPGYFYTVGADDCVTQCSSQDLQQEWLKYEGYKIMQEGYQHSEKSITLPHCLQMCISWSSSSCSVVVYDTVLQECKLFQVLQAPWPKGELSADSDCVLYQRMCV